MYFISRYYSDVASVLVKEYSFVGEFTAYTVSVIITFTLCSSSAVSVLVTCVHGVHLTLFQF